MIGNIDIIISALYILGIVTIGLWAGVKKKKAVTAGASNVRGTISAKHVNLGGRCVAAPAPHFIDASCGDTSC